MSHLRRLIREIHRRSLWQVLGIYVTASWVALEVANTLTEGFGLPGWFPAFALGLLIVGLPIVLGTAFVQEGGPGGSGGRDEVPVPSGEAGSPPARPRRSQGAGTGLQGIFTWRNAVAGGVAAFALWGVAAAAWLLLGLGPVSGPSPGGSGTHSIAVLPFDVIGDDPEDAVFAEGIHEDLLTELSKISGLTVIARTSVLRFRGAETPMAAIGDELGVTTLLEGTVRRSGDRIRINAQLIDADTEGHLWAETFTTELDDVFAVQTEIARDIARELRVTLTPADEERMGGARPVDPEVYRLYLRGRFFWNRRTEEGIREAIRLFQEATRLDPDNARAWAALADAHMLLPYYAPVSPEEAYTGARTAADRALELDESLAEAHAALGLIRRAYELSWDAAERSYLRAIELNPGHASAHQWYGNTLVYQGRIEEGLAELERARRLDPLAPIISTNIGDAHLYAGEWESALQEYGRALELDPRFPYALLGSGRALLALGEAGEAERLILDAVDLSGETPRTLAGLGYLYAVTRREEAAREILRRLEEREEAGAPSSAAAALVHAGLGDAAGFFERARRARLERDPWLTHLVVDPAVLVFEEDVRWSRLLEDMRLR